MAIYKMAGLCKGIVVDINDPAGFNRIRVRIPELHGPIKKDVFNNMPNALHTHWVKDEDLPWAEVAYPYASNGVPEINQVVIVGFISGEDSAPVVLGWLGYEYTSKEEEFTSGHSLLGGGA